MGRKTKTTKKVIKETTKWVTTKKTLAKIQKDKYLPGTAQKL